MTRPPPIRSADSKFDAEGYETIKDDINTLALASARSDMIYLGGPDRVQIPVAGRASVYVVSNLATAGSTLLIYHILACYRNGYNLGPTIGSVTLESRYVEIPAFQVRSLGEFVVGQGDILALNLFVNGAPVPTLTLANFTMRVDLMPNER